MKEKIFESELTKQFCQLNLPPFKLKHLSFGNEDTTAEELPLCKPAIIEKWFKVMHHAIKVLYLNTCFNPKY